MIRDDDAVIREIAEIAGELCEMSDTSGGCLVSNKRCSECDLTRAVAVKIFERCLGGVSTSHGNTGNRL